MVSMIALPLISIHAPTRGATRSRKNGSGQRRISIHAPTRGATLCAFPLPDPYIFQSTLPRGERLVSSWDTLITSVHFNPRSHEGSDAELRNNPVHLRNFNPRSHEGSDNTFTNGNPIRIQFQSTLPRGERPTAPYDWQLPQEFQSTLPRGERHGGKSMDLMKKDFNPRSHEGSDDITKYQLHLFRQFQSTLPRGERLICLY